MNMYNYYILLLILLVLILILIIIPHKYIIHRPISQNSLDLIMGNNNKSETFTLKLNYINKYIKTIGSRSIKYYYKYETPIISKNITLNNCSYIIYGSFKINKIYDPLDRYWLFIEFWVKIGIEYIYVGFQYIQLNYDFNKQIYDFIPTTIKYNLISGIDRIQLRLNIKNNYNYVSYVYNPNITYNINLDYITFNI